MTHTSRSVKRRVKRRASKSVKRKLKQRQSRRHKSNKVMSGGGERYTRLRFYCHVCNLKEVESNKGILGPHNLVAEMIVTFDKEVPVRYTLLTNPLQCVSMKEVDKRKLNCLDIQLSKLAGGASYDEKLVEKSSCLRFPPELFNIVSQLNPFPPYTIAGYDRNMAFKKLLECLLQPEHKSNISGVTIPEYFASKKVVLVKYEGPFTSTPIQSVSIEKKGVLGFGKFILSCYDGNSYTSSVSFEKSNPFAIQFDKKTPSYSIKLSSPEDVPLEQASVGVPTEQEFENKDNEIDYGFYISSDPWIMEGEGDTDRDNMELTMKICDYLKSTCPLQLALDRTSGYHTKIGKAKINEYKRKQPTKNEKKLMEWNQMIYDKELQRVKTQIDQELADYARRNEERASRPIS